MSHKNFYFIVHFFHYWICEFKCAYLDFSDKECIYNLMLLRISCGGSIYEDDADLILFYILNVYFVNEIS